MNAGDKIVSLLATQGSCKIRGSNGIRTAIDSLKSPGNNNVHSYAILQHLYEKGIATYDQKRIFFQACTPVITPCAKSRETAYITGSYTDYFFNEAFKFAQKIGLKPQIHNPNNDLIPRTIVMSIGYNLSNLKDLADALKVEYTTTPLAFIMATELNNKICIPSEESFIQTIGSDMEWFNWSSSKFNGKPPRVNELNLGRRIRWGKKEYYLHRSLEDQLQVMTQQIDPRIGKWLCMKNPPLIYDRKKMRIAIPKFCPLPLEQTRVLGLCSYKQTQIIKNNRISDYYNIQSDDFSVFFDVPPIIAQLVADSMSCDLKDNVTF